MSNIPPELLILALGAVAGVVEGVKRVAQKDLTALAIILSSGATGGLLGLLLPLNPELGISIVTGIVVGFSATGYVTIAQDIGKNSL